MKKIDPNLIYPGSDLTNVFPEEGSDTEDEAVRALRKRIHKHGRTIWTLEQTLHERGDGVMQERPEEGADAEFSNIAEWPTESIQLAKPPPPIWEWKVLGTGDFVVNTPSDYSRWVRFWAWFFFGSKWRRL